MIDLARERFTKNLWTDRTSGTKPRLVTVRDEADQARCIVERILENRETGTLLKQQAVLFRTSSHSGPLEVELTRRNIPFVKFGGLKFLDAAHVKDMLALLRFVENPRDRVAGFRLMHLIPGVGPASAQRVLDAHGRRRRSARSPCRRPAAAARRRRLAELRRHGRRRSAIRTGRPTSNARGAGTSRISTGSTRMPRPAAPI